MELTSRERTREIARSMRTEEQSRFHNRLRILRNLGYDDLVAGEVIEPGDLDAWTLFAEDPYEWTIHCDSGTYGRLWAVIMRRELN